VSKRILFLSLFIFLSVLNLYADDITLRISDTVATIAVTNSIMLSLLIVIFIFGIIYFIFKLFTRNDDDFLSVEWKVYKKHHFEIWDSINELKRAVEKVGGIND